MKYYLIILISLLCGCSLNTTIIGKYASHIKPDCFEFKSDSTYLYEYKSFSYGYSTGVWRQLNKNTIILNSKIKNTTIPIKPERFNRLNTKDSILSITFNIIGKLKSSDYKCSIFINDTFYVIRRCDSLSSVKINKPIREIYLLFYRRPLVVTSTLISMPLSTDVYKPKIISCNLNIKTSFCDSLFSYRSFNNEKIKVKKKKIKIFNPITKRWEGIPKVSASANIFYSFFNKE